MVSTLRRRMRVVVLPAASVAVTLAVTAPSGRRATILQAPSAAAVASVERPPATTVTVVPGSAVPVKETALRAFSEPASGAVSASFGA